MWVWVEIQRASSLLVGPDALSGSGDTPFKVELRKEVEVLW